MLNTETREQMRKWADEVAAAEPQPLVVPTRFNSQPGWQTKEFDQTYWSLIQRYYRFAVESCHEVSDFDEFATFTRSIANTKVKVEYLFNCSNYVEFTQAYFNACKNAGINFKEHIEELTKNLNEGIEFNGIK